MRGARDETLAKARQRENGEALGGMRSPLGAVAKLASPDSFRAIVRPVLLDYLTEYASVEKWVSQLLEDEAPAAEVPDALTESPMHGLRMTLARSLGVSEPPSGAGLKADLISGYCDHAGDPDGILASGLCTAPP